MGAIVDDGEVVFGSKLGSTDLADAMQKQFLQK
jgi:hypothetical protein